MTPERAQAGDRGHPPAQKGLGTAAQGCSIWMILIGGGGQMCHVLVEEASTVASVARRSHQQALWAILALALPLFLPATWGFLPLVHGTQDPEAPGWREWG